MHSRVIDQVLLAGVIVWEGTAAVVLWTAALSWAQGRTGGERQQRARAGLTTLAGLWFAFAISTELFIAYDCGVDETAYWALAIGVLSTLVLTELLARPETARELCAVQPQTTAADAIGTVSRSVVAAC